MTKPTLALQAQPTSGVCSNCWEPYDKKEARQYRHPTTGELAYSVTTIIGGGVPQPWMGPWAAKMASEHMVANWLRLSKQPHTVRINEAKNAHKMYAEKAASLGDVVHNLVECWSKGIAFPDVPKEVDSYVNQFIDFLTTHRPEFIENEVTFWSHEHNYAGTADFIIKIDGKTYLADLKTGRNLHSEIGMQLSALAHADCILRPDGSEEPVPKIDALAGLHVRPRSWKLVEIPDVSFPYFLASKNVMDWTINIAPHVLE